MPASASTVDTEPVTGNAVGKTAVVVGVVFCDTGSPATTGLEASGAELGGVVSGTDGTTISGSVVLVVGSVVEVDGGRSVVVAGSVVVVVAGSVVVVDGGTVVVDGGTVVVDGVGQMPAGMGVVAVYEDVKLSSNVTVAVNDAVAPAVSTVVAVTVAAVWLDDDTARLKLTVWIVCDPAFDDVKLHVALTELPVQVAWADPPVKSWAEAGPAATAIPSALKPSVSSAVPSSGRTLTKLTPVARDEGSVSRLLPEGYATNSARRLVAPALCCPNDKDENAPTT